MRRLPAHSRALVLSIGVVMALSRRSVALSFDIGIAQAAQSGHVNDLEGRDQEEEVLGGSWNFGE
jgi:hypothetical protein